MTKIDIAYISSDAPSHAPKPPPLQKGLADTSGKWVIIPGLLVISWDYKPGEVDVTVTALWSDIARLTGKLDPTKAVLKDDLDILGCVTGDFEIDANFNGADKGLWASGDLVVFTKKWAFKEKLLSW